LDNYKKFDSKYKKELLTEMDKQLKPKLSDTEIADIDIEKTLKINDMEFNDKDLKKLSDKVKKQQSSLYWALNETCFEVLIFRSGELRQYENSFADLVG
jgi:hypothetical protein